MEIDQSSELYKTIVAAIIKDDQSEDEMLDNVFDQDQDSKTSRNWRKFVKDVRDETNIYRVGSELTKENYKS